MKEDETTKEKVKAIKLLQRKYEEQVERSIKDFERETGLVVDGIDVIYFLATPRTFGGVSFKFDSSTRD